MGKDKGMPYLNKNSKEGGAKLSNDKEKLETSTNPKCTAPVLQAIHSQQHKSKTAMVVSNTPCILCNL
jgi:hypothetical protein